MTKSQEESEKPAKVYQLDAVIKEIADFRTDINGQLGAILGEVKGVVTQSQLDTTVATLKTYVDEQTKSLSKDIKLRYEPTKVTIDKWSKFGWSALLSVFGILATQVFLIIRVTVLGS